MKNYFRQGLLPALVLLLHLPLASAQNGQGPENIDRDNMEIRRHIESIFQAYLEEDIQTIRATHSQDWTGFQNASSTIERGLESYMKNAHASLANFQMLSYQIDDMEIQHYGSLAVVFYVASTEFRLKKDDSIVYPVSFKSLDIYRKDDLGWIQSGSNITIIQNRTPGERGQ